MAIQHCRNDLTCEQFSAVKISRRCVYVCHLSSFSLFFYFPFQIVNKLERTQIHNCLCIYSQHTISSTYDSSKSFCHWCVRYSLFPCLSFKRSVLSFIVNSCCVSGWYTKRQSGPDQHGTIRRSMVGVHINFIT